MTVVHASVFYVAEPIVKSSGGRCWLDIGGMNIIHFSSLDAMRAWLYTGLLRAEVQIAAERSTGVDAHLESDYDERNGDSDG